MKITPVILAGGTGTRLWPLSRELHPKQFLPITSEKSLLQETVLRAGAFKNISKPIVVCNEEHRFLVAEQLREISCSALSIILEPEGRNTAPALALAAFESIEKEDTLLLVLPADHIVKDVNAFQKTVNLALPVANEGKFVTFGVKPIKPETAYGYIGRGDSIKEGIYSVADFIEKPDKENAKKYIEDAYLWNSGVFLVKASLYLELLKKFEPEIFNSCQEAFNQKTQDVDFIRVANKPFLECISKSIDFAILEKTKKSLVLELDAGWDDLSSWSTLWSALEKDDSGNVSKGDVTLKNTSDSMVIASRRQVCTIGVKDLVIVETDTSILVADKNEVQKVKELAEELKSEGREEVKLHRQVCRPWGKFDSIDKGERFQVKRITVNAGEKLSKQMHYHRAEHWIVVSGTAKVTNGDEEIILTENQSTYIPLGTVHALENPGNVPLEIIEVQSGSYLGEDDIVRFEDRYGRAVDGESG